MIESNNTKIFLPQNVYDAALARIEWIFKEFKNVVVQMSGGKDSTVIFYLSLEVARRQKRLPLVVRWLDQEAEWQATVEYVREIMYRNDVEPRWYQMPMRMSNSTSGRKTFIHIWDPAARDMWIHPQDPISRKENIYGEDRFHDMFAGFDRVEYPNEPVAVLSGVRAEESPQRKLGTTSGLTYKWITWGRITNRKRHHYVFHPIYDWSYTDVWKAIYDNGWKYNRMYNLLYAYGVPINTMRISSLHHEKSIVDVLFAQEVEPVTYDRLVRRVDGIHALSRMEDEWFDIRLPPMFRDWWEYRDYLLEHLFEKPEEREHLRRLIANTDRRYRALAGEKLAKAQLKSIIRYDWEGTMLMDALSNPDFLAFRRAASDKTGQARAYVERLKARGKKVSLSDALRKDGLRLSGKVKS